jgi:hypothetical protein
MLSKCESLDAHLMLGTSLQQPDLEQKTCQVSPC